FEAAPGHRVRCLRTAQLGVVERVEAAPIAGPAADDRARLLAVTDLRCSYGGAAAPAVDGVSIEIARGETLAVVGESGSGKTTLLRAVAGLHPPASGEIAYEGEALAGRTVERTRDLRRQIQLVFQNPHASLNPRHTIRQVLARPLE